MLCNSLCKAVKRGSLRRRPSTGIALSGIYRGAEKQGTSLSAVSRNSGLASSTLASALNRRWPKGERLIAEALDVAPEKIWPSHYL
ncbi:helix-turn-helix domain-containing protein [Salmonella enterica]|nr:helix-turn-helix domain-containing protein [Salmonella enterica]